MGAVAVLSVVIVLLLDPVARRAEYDNSPAVTTEILLAVIAVLAALICAALLLARAFLFQRKDVDVREITRHRQTPALQAQLRSPRPPLQRE